MNSYWNPGDTIALRWIANGRVWIAQPLRVISDSPNETALLLWPDTVCVVPEQVWQTDPGQARDVRWAQERSGVFTRRTHAWHTNRLLMLLEPDKYYALIHFWHHATNTFTGYYVNFQLPFQRSRCGFDTYDLELDIIIEPSLAWRYKDERAYQDGIAQGNIKPEWVEAIERAKAEVFESLSARAYPFDGHWTNYFPGAHWAPPVLPAGWEAL